MGWNLEMRLAASTLGFHFSFALEAFPCLELPCVPWRHGSTLCAVAHGATSQSRAALRAGHGRHYEPVARAPVHGRRLVALGFPRSASASQVWRPALQCGVRLWILWDDRNGCPGPSEPGCRFRLLGIRATCRAPNQYNGLSGRPCGAW